MIHFETFKKTKDSIFYRTSDRWGQVLAWEGLTHTRAGGGLFPVRPHQWAGCDFALRAHRGAAESAGRVLVPLLLLLTLHTVGLWPFGV